MENDAMQEELPEKEVVEQNDSGPSLKVNKTAAIILACVVVLGVIVYAYKGLVVAALVDGAPISRFAVIHDLEKTGGKNALDNLITERLIKNAVKAENIVVTDEEVDAEIKTIEEQITAQGGTLDALLEAQGLNMDDVKNQLTLQKGIEKLLADKISVTDEEVLKYMVANEIPAPGADEEAAVIDQIRETIKVQKFDAEVQDLITALRVKAKITYFVQY